MRRKKKIVMLAKSKLNSIESKTSEALINNEIIMKTLWQLLMRIKYGGLKESIRMMISQRSDAEKIINLIEEGKKQALMKLLSAMKLLIAV